MYSTGYNGRVRTLDELLAWVEWNMLPPELRGPVLWILDEARLRGRPIGIGSIGRTEQAADDLARSRHHVVLVGGCCKYQGKRYQLTKGNAHAAFSDRTYHVTMTPSTPRYSLAIDFTGDMAMLAELVGKVGMQEFSKINREPWHGQGVSYPTSRARWVDSWHWPLPHIKLPPHTGSASPVRLYAPTPTLRQRTRADLLLGRKNDEAQVRAMQHLCNFWGWRDALNRTLIVDGDFGSKSAQAVMAMQRALGLVADGQYGPASHRGLQKFLDYMAAQAAGKV